MSPVHEISEIVSLILEYYKRRGLKWPTASEAIDWHDTEMGEVQEIILARSGGWVRNNPENKPEWDVSSFAEELGDAIFMLIVAGLVEGVDPLIAMTNKLRRKLEELNV